MKRLYHLVTEQQFSRCQRQDKYRKLLFALCFFHSVLLERKKFLQLGWNIPYGFNDSDFEVGSLKIIMPIFSNIGLMNQLTPTIQYKINLYWSDNVANVAMLLERYC